MGNHVLDFIGVMPGQNSWITKSLLSSSRGMHRCDWYHCYQMDEEDEKDEKEGLENDKDEEMSPVVDTVTAAALGSVAESYHFPPDAG